MNKTQIVPTPNIILFPSKCLCLSLPHLLSNLIFFLSTYHSLLNTSFFFYLHHTRNIFLPGLPKISPLFYSMEIYWSIFFDPIATFDIYSILYLWLLYLLCLKFSIFFVGFFPLVRI